MQMQGDRYDSAALTAATTRADIPPGLSSRRQFLGQVGGGLAVVGGGGLLAACGPSKPTSPTSAANGASEKPRRGRPPHSHRPPGRSR
jgi:hypothetical protein